MKFSSSDLISVELIPFRLKFESNGGSIPRGFIQCGKVSTRRSRLEHGLPQLMKIGGLELQSSLLGKFGPSSVTCTVQRV